jgi:hypothetical protein
MSSSLADLYALIIEQITNYSPTVALMDRIKNVGNLYGPYSPYAIIYNFIHNQKGDNVDEGVINALQALQVALDNVAEARETSTVDLIKLIEGIYNQMDYLYLANNYLLPLAQQLRLMPNAHSILMPTITLSEEITRSIIMIVNENSELEGYIVDNSFAQGLIYLKLYALMLQRIVDNLFDEKSALANQYNVGVDVKDEGFVVNPEIVRPTVQAFINMGFLTDSADANVIISAFEETLQDDIDKRFDQQQDIPLLDLLSSLTSCKFQTDGTNFPEREDWINNMIQAVLGMENTYLGGLIHQRIHNKVDYVTDQVVHIFVRNILTYIKLHDQSQDDYGQILNEFEFILDTTPQSDDSFPVDGIASTGFSIPEDYIDVDSESGIVLFRTKESLEKNFYIVLRAHGMLNNTFALQQTHYSWMTTRIKEVLSEQHVIKKNLNQLYQGEWDLREVKVNCQQFGEYAHNVALHLNMLRNLGRLDEIF